jgi:hypothetical protein
MARYFYDEDNDVQIVDVSGKLGVEDVKQRFNAINVKDIGVFSEDDGFEVVNGKARKYNARERVEQIKQTRAMARQAKITQIINKLGLTRQEFETLKEALGIEQ